MTEITYGGVKVTKMEIRKAIDAEGKDHLWITFTFESGLSEQVVT